MDRTELEEMRSILRISKLLTDIEKIKSIQLSKLKDLEMTPTESDRHFDYLMGTAKILSDYDKVHEKCNEVVAELNYSTKYHSKDLKHLVNLIEEYVEEEIRGTEESVYECVEDIMDKWNNRD